MMKWFRYYNRMFHTSLICSGQVEKSLLAKLRKKTGYSFVNCKKALEVHSNDLEKATSWLHEQAQKEGWAKAEKLQGRQTTQGSIGIMLRNKLATMVEMNCETDFVARNKEFQKLLSTITSAFHSHVLQSTATPDTCCKVQSDPKELMTLAWEEQNDKSLFDLVALKIGHMGENMTIRRAVSLRVADHLQVQCSVHPFDEAFKQPEGFFYGKYGALVAFEKSPSQLENTKELPLAQCGWQLAQHIIGMNPKTIGELTDEKPEGEDEGGAENDATTMVHQEFLSDPLITVGDFLQQYGIRIMDFARYECGEVTEESK